MTFPAKPLAIKPIAAAMLLCVFAAVPSFAQSASQPPTVREAFAREVAECQKSAIAAFPDLSVPGSAFNEAFVAEVARLRKDGAPVLEKSSWPMTVARRVDAILNRPDTVAADGSPKDPFADLPRRANLRPLYETMDMAIKSQGRRGSCTIFGTLGVLEFQYRKSGGNAQLSEQFVMWGANQIGRYKRDAFSFDDVIAAIQEFGVCREDLLPYKEWGNIRKPDKEAIADAATRRNIDVQWLHRWSGKPGLDRNGLLSICKSIASGDPVTASTVWPRNALLDAEHFLQDRGSKLGSGHAIVLVGYEMDEALEGGGAFTFRQSWGDDWGDCGYAKLSFAFAAENIKKALTLRVGKAPAH